MRRLVPENDDNVVLFYIFSKILYTGLKYIFRIKYYSDGIGKKDKGKKCIQWAHTKMVHGIAVLIIMTSKHFWLLQSM